MNVFELRQRLVDDYADFTRSFVNIADERIAAHVDRELEAGLLWPEPIVQLNPAFEPGGTIDDLVAEGLLDERCRQIFRRVGIVEANGPVTRDSPEVRWPWRCPVKPHLVLGAIDERAPSLADVLLQSHIQLTEDEYTRARSALEDVFDRTRGDLLGRWPFFETRLRHRLGD